MGGRCQASLHSAPGLARCQTPLQLRNGGSLGQNTSPSHWSCVTLPASSAAGGCEYPSAHFLTEGSRLREGGTLAQGHPASLWRRLEQTPAPFPGPRLFCTSPSHPGGMPSAVTAHGAVVSSVGHTALATTLWAQYCPRPPFADTEMRSRVGFGQAPDPQGEERRNPSGDPAAGLSHVPRGTRLPSQPSVRWGGEACDLIPISPGDGEPLSQQQAGPEAGVTVGRVLRVATGSGCSWREGGQKGPGTCRASPEPSEPPVF